MFQDPNEETKESIKRIEYQYTTIDGYTKIKKLFVGISDIYRYSEILSNRAILEASSGIGKPRPKNSLLDCFCLIIFGTSFSNPPIKTKK